VEVAQLVVVGRRLGWVAAEQELGGDQRQPLFTRRGGPLVAGGLVGGEPLSLGPGLGPLQRAAAAFTHSVVTAAEIDQALLLQPPHQLPARVAHRPFHSDLPYGIGSTMRCATCDLCKARHVVLSPVLSSESRSPGREHSTRRSPACTFSCGCGLGGSAVVGAEEARRLSREVSSALVALRRRDLTRLRPDPASRPRGDNLGGRKRQP
jgi:hypothetical protein